MTVPTPPLCAVCPTSPEDPISDDAYEAVIAAMDALIAQAPVTLQPNDQEELPLMDDDTCECFGAKVDRHMCDPLDLRAPWRASPVGLPRPRMVVWAEWPGLA